MNNKDYIELLINKASKSIPSQTEQEKKTFEQMSEIANNILLYGKVSSD